jgi:hypothetical protein
MSKRKNTKTTAAKPDPATTTPAQLKTYARLREIANRKLLKRRRQKSGQ